MSLLTDELRALIGTRRVYTAPEPFGAAAFRYFGLAVGDDNPLYRDAAFARAHGLDGVTAPLTLICETNQYADVPLDADGFAGHSWDLDVPGTRQVRGGNSYTFHRRVRPDDVVTATWEIRDLTEKTTPRGAGHAGGRPPGPRTPTSTASCWRSTRRRSSWSSLDGGR